MNFTRSRNSMAVRSKTRSAIRGSNSGTWDTFSRDRSFASCRRCEAGACPLEGCVKRWYLEDRESQLYLGVSVRTVLHAVLSVFNFYRGSGFRHLQRIAPDKEARLDESLVISAPRTGV